MNIHRVLIYTVFVLLLFAPTVKADQDAFFSRDLPEPDRAEVMSVAPGATEGPQANLDEKQAHRLIARVRTLAWLGPAGSCDKMQYVLRFYANNRLIAARGICFHCGCFVPLDSDLHPGGNALSFDPQTAQARALEMFLVKLFPAGS